MLNCLRIRDLAIVEELDLELGSGLNVLTGETGAGKSVLVGALELVLGAKAKPELVRSGAKDGEVEALFDIRGDAPVRERLRAMSLGASDELVVRRVVSSSGRARAFVNGKLATQQTLAELTRGLADISSQHEHHTLTDPSTHLGYLDAFGGLAPLRERVSGAYAALRHAEAARRSSAERLRDRAAREAVLRSQIADIEGTAPKSGEDIDLERACARLRGTEALLRLTGEAVDWLCERDDAVLSSIARIRRRVLDAAALDEGFVPLASRFDSIVSELEDAARELARQARSIRAEPEALESAEARLHALSKLKRRYGSLDAALAHLERDHAELDELSQQEQAQATLELARTAALEAAGSAARALSEKRRGAALELGRSIARELALLGMPGARVDVKLSARPAGAGEMALDGERLTADGLETAELLIAPNRGEDARSLHRVASGGELSRAMLAVKCVLAGLGPSGMYVFDEVDAGVGGAMAEVIGRKIRNVAHHRQVLCITHLPQIAVFAEHHFKVEKAVQGERTVSTVRRLTWKEQREEIARMLGGLNITAKTRAAARELLLHARSSAA
jgi:DNA repair protein RecN (Recombination protein N)